MKTGRIIATFPLILLALLLASGRALAAESLHYTGSSTISLSILYQGALKGFEKKTGHKFDSIDTLSGTGKGLDKLVQGKANLCGSGRDLTPEEKARGLVQTTVAFDALALWVNSANPLTGLTRAQAKGVLTGKTRNWSEVGGRNRPIQLLLEPLGEKRASEELLQALVMDRVPFSPHAIVVDNHRAQILEVSRNPDALCVASQGLNSTFSSGVLVSLKKLSIDGVPPEGKAISDRTYLICRPLNLVTLGPPEGKVKAFIDYLLSPEGQAIVSRSFVPVRPLP